MTPGEIIYTYCGHAGMDALTHPAPFYKSSSVITLVILSLLFLTLKVLKSYQRRQQAKISET
ncbi:hypothetical protein [Legionella tunisiensis]|uniref:hypothetical protein n=1 Tax=Legionella tunisiensis TaxID=1034944 RepID=UPI001E36809E|nr:hypothetical protein [Legionella tunisiensis]